MQRVAVVEGVEDAEESRWRLLMEHAHELIAVLDLDGVVIEANRRWEELLGLSPGGLVGRRISELAAEGYGEINTAEYKRVVRAGVHGSAKGVLVRRQGGGVAHVDFATSTVMLGGHPVVLSIGRDVTEQTRTAAALLASEERHRGLIERLPEIVWSGTADGKVHFISGNVVGVCGVTPEMVYEGGAAWWRKRIHSEDRALAKHDFVAFLADGTAFDVEYRWQHPDGHWIWLRSRSSARYVVDGLVHYDGVISDVTQQRHLEEGLRQAQKVEAVGLLASGIAHDFNNLLAVIMADAYELAAGLAPGDPRRELAQEIEDTAVRAATLTRQLLMFSRKQVVQPEVLAVGAVLDDLGRLLRRVIGEDIVLDTRTASRLGRIFLDRGELEQILLNLAVNARDAMPNGGALTIEVASVDVDEGTLASCVGAGAPGRHVLISVSDTGCGMSQRIRKRIFEPFFTTKPVGKGTGLGLSTVFGIVTRAGGAIDVDSAEGVGTRFRVYLPHAVDAREERRGRATNVAFAGQERLLLVEDDELVRTVTRRILEAAGYQVTTACDGAEAIASLDAGGEVDLVLTDVVMPVSSGPDLVAALRGRNPPLKVLFMSGYSDHAALDDARADGASFIAKPFTPQGLLKKLREILGGAGG
jgi:two-component system, cell cycle sensor histidine kinase and response regulator CckA